MEKDDGCGEIANRTMTADFGASQEQVIEDVVEQVEGRGRMWLRSADVEGAGP